MMCYICHREIDEGELCGECRAILDESKNKHDQQLKEVYDRGFKDGVQSLWGYGGL